MNMTIRKAVKEGKAVEVNLDEYLLDDNRIIVYDRYYNNGLTAKWVDENGNVYRNFHEAYYQI